ncbi:ABC transporter related protein [Denitrovibrio acetiphilus DSM 12809]|uniref:ABC transporter related protein n=1 Tax=Denitrovibrio acetiphilus (strain DSM 12809 / NBRC 114555 / N2460) TaxID=522772 RepID=D4H0K6_DENA2|nr:ABC transporter ATP-binding protein [Denitrovibrio acetiphilus]ADD68519.1 ABC transporter related protein [Denitrovibrio acetiphilus DSM 12809]
MLEVNDLTIELKSSSNSFIILRSVNFTLKKGEILGIAGESGSGKTILAKTILNLIKNPVVKTAGEIILDGKTLKTEKDFRAVRGKKISMIFQNPTASLNPVFTVGSQIIETIRTHNPEISAKEAEKRAEELLSEVEIPHPKERLKSFPHQLSGGMNQRVMIAMALASSPEILIADEPTTALDVTIQQQIVELIKKLNREKELSVIFITHDLSLLAQVADESFIMYAGEMMERLTGKDLKDGNMRHPYTRNLQNCVPKLGDNREFLNTIKGTITFNNSDFDNACIFHPRCEKATDKCRKEKPEFINGFSCFYPH